MSTATSEASRSRRSTRVSPKSTSGAVAGSAEVAPQVGLSDWIVDLVATGATLAANDLAIVEEIAPSTARLIANPAAYHQRRDEIAPLVQRLARWAAAR